MDEQARHQLRQAKLSRLEMLCLALNHYDGLTVRAIAKRLDMPRSTVMDYITGGRWKLKRAGLSLRSLTREGGRMLVVGEGDMPPTDIKVRW